MLNREQATKKLYSNSADLSEQHYDRAFIAEFKDRLNDPQFETKTDPEDWQYYVPTETKEFWHYVDEIARILIWMTAFRQIPSSED